MRQRVGGAARAVAAAVVMALGVTAACRGARAQPPPSSSSQGVAPAGEERRTALYRAASEAAAAGRWAEAKAQLTEALAIRSSPKVLYELGQAEEQLGQVASALGDYVRALEGARAAGESDVVAAAEQARAAVEARVPHVRVVVSGPGAGAASATLDGKPAVLGAAIALDPGTHALVVSAPGAREVTTSVAIGERQQLDVPVRLEAAAPVAAPAGAGASVGASPPAPAASGGSSWRTVSLVVAGVGVVGLGVGAGFGVESMSKHSDAQKACPGATCADASGAGLWRDAVSAGNVSTAAFVVGGVLLAGGAVFWLVAPGASDGSAAQVGVGPGSVQVRGVW